MSAIVLVLLVLITLLCFKYPYLSLILFLTTGFVKTSLRLEGGIWGGVDYTLLCSCVLLFAMLSSFIKNRGQLKDIFSGGVAFYILLLIIMSLGWFYTSSPLWGRTKTISFATFSFITILSPLFFSVKLQDIKLIIVLLFISGLLITLGTIIAPDASVADVRSELRGGFLEASALTSASFIAMSLIITYCIVIARTSNKIVRLICLVLLLPMVYAMILTKSRGPFVGAGICIFVAMILAYRRIPKIAFVIVPVIVFLGAVIMLIKMPYEQSERILNIFKGTSYLQEEAYSRTSLFQFAIEGAMKSPVFGHGTGAFAVDYTGADERAYPHNIFLELFYENGLIGVAIFMGFLFFIFKYWIQCRKMANEYYSEEVQWMIDIIALLVLFTFIQANKSAAITGQRPFFFSCGLMLAAYKVLFNGLTELYYSETEPLYLQDDENNGIDNV